MGNRSVKAPLSGLMNNVQFFPFPYLYRCPFALAEEQSVQTNLHYLETMLSDPESGVLLPAAIIVEPIQGEGGVIPAPISWLQGLREITKRYHIPLIFDEIQCGIGRSGSMFAFETAGVVPDILVLSKAIGGGLPMALVVYHQDLDLWQPGAHAGTFRGNPLAMVAGSATLDYLQENQLCRQVNTRGEQLILSLKELQQYLPCIGDVRGRGLMVGVEIVDTMQKKQANGALPTHPTLAKAIQQHCLRRGLIIELGGRDGSTVRFLPPLIISAEELAQVTEIFAQAASCEFERIR